MDKGRLKGEIALAVVANLLQADLPDGVGVEGEVVEIAAVSRIGMIELGDNGGVSYQPIVEFGQGIKLRVGMVGNHVNIEQVDMPGRVVGPLDTTQSYKRPRRGSVYGLG